MVDGLDWNEDDTHRRRHSSLGDLGTSGLRRRLHPPMNDSYRRWLSSRGQDEGPDHLIEALVIA